MAETANNEDAGCAPHCCCCGYGEPCCDCGEIRPYPTMIELANDLAQEECERSNAEQGVCGRYGTDTPDEYVEDVLTHIRVCAAACETIVAAAIRIRNTTATIIPPDYPEVLIVSAPPPARHHSLMHPIATMVGRCMRGPEDQGFLTSKGRYVGREEALKIAIASGQSMIDHPSRHATQLFSEDLW
jgi:hypothetical protein